MTKKLKRTDTSVRFGANAPKGEKQPDRNLIFEIFEPDFEKAKDVLPFAKALREALDTAKKGVVAEVAQRDGLWVIRMTVNPEVGKSDDNLLDEVTWALNPVVETSEELLKRTMACWKYLIGEKVVDEGKLIPIPKPT